MIYKLQHIIKDEKVKAINDVSFDENDWQTIVNRCFDRMQWKILSSPKYHLIHGDCQFSNTLYVPDQFDSQKCHLVFVDPRGYYGKSMVYGYNAYDFGKVAYALSGYDLFNSDQNLFAINIKDGVVQLDIPDNFEELLVHFAKEAEIDANDLVALLCVNWLGLAEYFSNNPLKSMGAMLYAQYYFRKYLKDNVYDMFGNPPDNLPNKDDNVEQNQ